MHGTLSNRPRSAHNAAHSHPTSPKRKRRDNPERVLPPFALLHVFRKRIFSRKSRCFCVAAISLGLAYKSLAKANAAKVGDFCLFRVSTSRSSVVCVQRTIIALLSSHSISVPRTHTTADQSLPLADGLSCQRTVGNFVILQVSDEE